MAGKKKQRKKPEVPASEVLIQALLDALEKQDDFIVTYESADEGDRRLHMMTGKLITPCMLGTLTNRCELPDQDGSKHTVLEKV